MGLEERVVRRQLKMGEHTYCVISLEAPVVEGRNAFEDEELTLEEIILNNQERGGKDERSQEVKNVGKNIKERNKKERYPITPH